MLLYILIGLAALIAGLLFVASRKPDRVHYERSIVINAAPERILPHIHDFRKWAPWSPWEKKDPNMKREYNGAASGVGAKYGWQGDNNVGQGTMEITEAAPNGVRIEMLFIRPWKAQCDVHFRTAAEGSATRLVWTMDGPQIFMGKVMSLFMDMDKMIGKDFEAGLAGLKAEVERS